MRNCRTCIYWSTSDIKMLSAFSNNHGYCEKSEAIDKTDMMIATCMSEGIEGELITRDDFGCVMHEAININYDDK